MDYNPHLKSWHAAQPDARHQPTNEAGQGRIEQPGDVENIVWQTRSAQPTEYETQLCDALESLFKKEIEDLEAIVAGLNRMGLKTSAGENWTESQFWEEMQRLGA